MPVEKFSVSLMPRELAQVDRREGARSTSINKCLERYFWLIDHERRNLRQLFSDGEIALLCDLMNGTMFADPYSVQFIAAEAQDGIALDQLDAKWKIDGPALIAKLKGLSYGSNLALIDAVQLWWHRSSMGEPVKLTVEDVLGAGAPQLRYPHNGNDED